MKAAEQRNLQPEATSHSSTFLRGGAGGTERPHFTVYCLNSAAVCPPPHREHAPVFIQVVLILGHCWRINVPQKCGRRLLA